jgi:hypothetical protein
MGTVDVGIWLHTACDPPQDEWDDACRTVANMVERANGDISRYRTFVASDGGAPNARQRKQMNRDILRGYPVKTALVTTVLATSAVKRGIVTALQWLNPQFGFFRPAEILLALDRIDVAPARFHSIWTVLQSMQESLGPNETLRLVGTALGLSAQS